MMVVEVVKRSGARKENEDSLIDTVDKEFWFDVEAGPFEKVGRFFFM